MKELTPIETTARQMLEAGMTCSEAAREIRKAIIAVALRKHKGNLCHAARALGMHRNTLGRSLEKLRMTELPRQLREEIRAQRDLAFERARQQQRQAARPPAGWQPASRPSTSRAA